MTQVLVFSNISYSSCSRCPVKLFEMFHQVDASAMRRYGGTGLGLYISKLIVKAHSGKIWAGSEEGVGTRIHLLFQKVR